MSSRRPPYALTTLDIDIVELEPGGLGVGHAEHRGARRAVFIPRTAPGDRVRVEVDFSSRPARGRPLSLLTPSPSRQAPPCAHFERCGGCNYMHLTPVSQARAHTEVLLAHLPGPYRTAPLLSHPATTVLGYRARARLHVRARGSSVEVGMHGERSRTPIQVDRCIVLAPELDLARLALPGLLRGARGDGEAELALGRPRASSRAPVLVLQWKGELPGAVFSRLEAAVLEGSLDGASVWSEGARAPASIGAPSAWTPGADGLPLELPPGGFAQAHEEGNTALVRAVTGAASELVEEGSEGRLVELYAGSGNLTISLAPLALRLTAVEANPLACEAARRNLQARGLEARVVQADADTYSWPKDTRLIVLDPPRTGARKVAESLAARPVHGVVYLSCDPVTLGRDLAILAPRYELLRLETFEMFPQTSHVEILAVLRRASR